MAPADQNGAKRNLTWPGIPFPARNPRLQISTRGGRAK